ncbi:hypothetical protein M407DRAFT_23865 [Tulasnella calospora MUT 4182]|uniref:Uncharacterized protein n=1 Tax=Tulasnella calospora MUT 4182 TaxID=1051891 RepID=A0A0C3QKJ4_9AGAM|nr:hypothetical protein M407DRAFT_23865 [Tulasnella calospora MUT 4182]
MTTNANADSTSNIQQNESSDGLGALKKSRRQTAFYPNIQNIPSNPFSKSAAKRESVMALGSIEHLQHYFTKTGLASKRKTTKVKGLVPALGPSIIPTLEISGVSSSTSSFELPPSPVVQTVSRPPYPHVERVYPQTDPDALKPGLIRDLEETEKAWSIGVDSKEKEKADSGPLLLTASNIKKQAENSFEVLSVLQTTTRTIRSVRNYLVSLPDDQFLQPTPNTNKSLEHRSTGGSGFLRQAPGTTTMRPSLLPGSTTSSAPPSVPFPSAPADPHARIRKAAMDVLAMLRLLEESYRIPLSDDAYDSLSVGSSGGGDVPLSVSDEFVSTGAPTPPRSLGSGRSSVVTATTDKRGSGIFSVPEDDDNESATSASASHAGSGGSASRRESSSAAKLLPKAGVTTAFVPLRGNGATIQVWVDEEDNLLDDPLESPKPKREAWDERLVLGGGWLYKQVSLNDLGEQKAVVEKYLDIVDEVLFEGPSSTPSALFGSQLPQAAHYHRGWQRVKASLPTTSRLRRTRSSLGPSPSHSQSPTESEVAGPSAGSGNAGGSSSLRRVSSNGILPNILNDAFVAEPEDVGGKNSDMLDDVAEGDEEEDDGEFEDGELAEWARRDRFADDVLARLWSILSAHLPSQLLEHLPSYTSSADREALLIRLSDGQLLCHAYNAIVRRSRKQWGFIGAASIHDIVALEAKQKEVDAKKVIGWTFRRMENLRLWAAALKLRHLVALAPPSQSPPLKPGVPPSPIPSQSSSPVKPSMQSMIAPHVVPVTVSRVLNSMGPAAPFDAKLIAKREVGWDEMLQVALQRWVDAILKETRSKNTHT